MKYTEFYVKNLRKEKYINYFNEHRTIFLDQSPNAIVLFETRELEHLEFTLKYTYSQLQNNFWSAYIFCSPINVDGIKSMLQGYNVHFVVIDTEFNRKIEDINDYNRLLLSKRLWKYFISQGIEKILLFQEDSILFRTGVEDYLQYDYIGAPWNNKKHGKMCPLEYGNGGLTIRNTQLSLKLLQEPYKSRIDVFCESKNDGKNENKNEKKINEDKYFSIGFYLLRIDYGLLSIHLPELNIAKEFSIEQVYAENPVGGHQYWICKPDYKDLFHIS